MRILILTLFFLGFTAALKAQGTVTFKENIFNNNRFKIDGQEAKAPEVARLMSNFESSQKNFVEGHKQMRIGSWLMILGTATLAGSLINFGLSNGTQADVDTYILISAIGGGTGLVGGAIRKKGKKRVETSVSEYNFLKEKALEKAINLSVIQGRIGLVYTF